MPTTVHIPRALLKKVDERAKALGLSRNRLVIQALEQKLSPPPAWPVSFVTLLRKRISAEVAEDADMMFASILETRRSRKRPVKL